MTVETEIFDSNKLLIYLKGSKGNSFSTEMMRSLVSALEEAATNDSILGVILTGAGKIFSVGGNVFAMHEALEGDGAHTYLDDLVPEIEQAINLILHFPKPVIAAVNGAAAGAGMSLALACDEVITVDSTKFGMGFGGLGLSPDSGSSVLFRHYFGRREAIDGIATARVFSAEEMEKRKIVEIIYGDNLLDTASRRINLKTSVSAYSYAKTKLLVNQDLIQQLEHNFPLEYETIRDAAARQEFKDKVQQTINKLTKK